MCPEEGEQVFSQAQGTYIPRHEPLAKATSAVSSGVGATPGVIVYLETFVVLVYHRGVELPVRCFIDGSQRSYKTSGKREDGPRVVWGSGDPQSNTQGV